MNESTATRQRVRDACFAVWDPGTGRRSDEISCPYYLHRECPAQQADGSPRLNAYPFLVEKLVGYMEKSGSYFDCDADPEATYKPSDNDQSVNYSIVTERPGLVCVDESEDGYYAGAAHPYAQENIECFDTGTNGKVGFNILPALKSGSAALAA